MSYVDGTLCAVPNDNKAAYIAHAEAAAVLFKRHGALEMKECWGVDVPEGVTNSMHTAVMRKPDETIVFSWITWPSREKRDAAWEAIQNDPEMAGMDMPFDGSRLIFGGFEIIVDV